MRIIESGNIQCDCGNDELVWVQCLSPWKDWFRVKCRKCKAEGVIRANPDSLRPVQDQVQKG